MAKIQEGFSYENNSKEKHQTNITGRDTFFTYEIPCISGADDHVGGQEEQKGRKSRRAGTPGAVGRYGRRIKEIRFTDMMRRSGYGS